VGGFAHKLIASDLGLKIVAASDSRGGAYNPNGLEYGAVRKHKTDTGSISGFAEAERVSNEELLELDVDILVPSALEGVITAANASKIKAKVVLELANGPTTPEADEILSDMGVIVVPDVLANAGGVTVSCFEWIQGRTGDYWTEEEVHQKLDMKLTTAFHQIWKIKQEFGIRMRQAAYVRAISRIVGAMRFKGIWP